jgi:hypothetical protein
LLKEQGHHLSEQGAKVIDLILSQMNNNRPNKKRKKKIKEK